MTAVRIALATVYGNRGGSTAVLLAAADALAADHSVMIRAPLAEATHPMVAGLPSTPIDTMARKLWRVPTMLGLVARERRWLASVAPDLVYVHDEPSLYVHGTAARSLGIPVLWHMHMPEHAGLMGRLRRALASERIAIADFAVPPGAPPPLAVLRNPVMRHRLSRAAASPPRRLLAMGSLVQRKNPDIAIAATALLRARGVPVVLALVGEALDPPFAARLHAQAQSSGVWTDALFRGRLPAAEALDWSDLVLCLSALENQPLVLLEALFAGRPVVATDIPAHREIAALLQLDAGRLVPPQAAAVAEAVEAGRTLQLESPPEPDPFAANTFRETLRALVWRRWGVPPRRVERRRERG